MSVQVSEQHPDKASSTCPSPHPTDKSRRSQSKDEEKQRKPWKYSGYSVFSRLLGSDGDLLVVRRFGHLHARLIMWLQDSVVQLEEELDFIDGECSKTDGPDFNNGSFREEPIARRTEILRQLKQALQDYGKQSRLFCKEI